MLVWYSMQSYGASLVFLRTLSEVISEEYTSDYGEAIQECGRMCVCYHITQVKLRQFQKLMDSGGANVGDEDDKDEAEQMGETYAPWCWSCMLGTLQCRCSWEVHLRIWD